MLTELKENVHDTNPHPDSLMATLADWFECGLFAGFRLSEWAQEASASRMETFQLDVHGDAKALCLGDVRFASSTGARVSAADAVAAPPGTQFDKCWITFRTQKNGENGEEKLFTRNTNRGGMCFVSAMLRIVRRFARIRSAQDLATPLALYKGSPTCDAPSFVTSVQIEKMMRSLASKVYSLHPVKDKAKLQRWSSHSLRVAACMILHALGFTETQIKFLLRWRSNAFMMYLRNSAILANFQNEVLDRAMAMPNFL